MINVNNRKMEIVKGPISIADAVTIILGKIRSQKMNTL